MVLGQELNPKALGSVSRFVIFPMSRKKHTMLIKNGRIQDELVSDYAKFRAIKPSIL